MPVSSCYWGLAGVCLGYRGQKPRREDTTANGLGDSVVTGVSVSDGKIYGNTSASTATLPGMKVMTTRLPDRGSGLSWIVMPGITLSMIHATVPDSSR